MKTRIDCVLTFKKHMSYDITELGGVSASSSYQDIKKDSLAI